MEDIHNLYTQESHSFFTFYIDFIDICNNQRNPEIGHVFAFILYDFQNPQILKVLKDRDYWNSLDSISGQYLTIFSINIKPKISIRSRSAANNLIFRNMVSVNSFGDPSEAYNSIMNKYFSSSDEFKYPSVIFFQVERDEILDYMMIQLKEKQIEKSYLELQIYIQEVVDTLKQITPENSSNYKEIFNMVRVSVNSAEFFAKTKNKSLGLSHISQLFSFINKLVS